MMAAGSTAGAWRLRGSVGVAVHTDAEVTGRVEWLTAERAGGPTGLNEGGCRGREPTRIRSGHADTQQVRAFRIVIGNLGILPVFLNGPSLDGDRCRFRVPAQRQHADAEELDHRLRELAMGIGARERLWRLSSRDQKLTDTLSQGAHLRLLEANGDDGPALMSLQKEGTASRLADRSGQEPVRLIEDEETTRHLDMLQAKTAGGLGAERRSQTEGIGEVPALRSLSPVIPRLGRRLRDVCPPNRVAAQPKGTEPHLSILN